jgi:regulator of replication initiation timing
MSESITTGNIKQDLGSLARENERLIKENATLRQEFEKLRKENRELKRSYIVTHNFNRLA